MQRHAYRARLLDFKADPQGRSDADACIDLIDGLLLVENGVIAAAGPAAELLPQLDENTPVIDWRGKLIMPGFIDSHMHYAQADVIASHGPQLLEWLTLYTWPAEMRCKDAAYAIDVAEFSIKEMLRNGTTTAMVFATVHAHSVDAIFTAAARRGMRLIAGKVLMDRNGPSALLDDVQNGSSDSAALIERWHGKDRLAYALTPRFAPTSSNEQLAAAGELLRRYPGVYLQTHLAENRSEVEWVRELFPGARSYLDVYARHGLLGERSVFAHCLHLDQDDRRLFAASGCVACFCPSSNLFLGSGLFDMAAADEAGMRLSLGTDIGAGTSYGMLQTMHDAYKVANLAGYVLDPLRAFYLATLGGATALGLEDRIGRLAPGYEADFIVLNPSATAVQSRRVAGCETLRDLLFSLMMLGDDRSVVASYVLGKRMIIE